MYILRNDFYAKQFNPRIYPKNLLPWCLEKNRIYIVHSSDSFSSVKKGHFMVLDSLSSSKKALKICFFDSYGRKFPIPQIKNIIEYNINSCGALFCYNHVKFQASRSVICADLCLFFILWRSRGYNLKSIQTTKFYDSLKKNLERIPLIIDKLLPPEARERRKKKKYNWKDFR